MARLVAGMGSSHALALIDVDRWEGERNAMWARFGKRHGFLPPENPRMAEQDAAYTLEHFRPIREGLDRLRANLARLRPDALILLGDDQNENYLDDNLPQFAIYTGADVEVRDNASEGGFRDFSCHAALAQDLLSRLVDTGVDMASSARYPEGRLRSHAHAEMMTRIGPGMPVVPVFVNAVNPPAATPKRCFEVGQRLRQAIEASPAVDRVVILASGGLSHFTASYPWRHYTGSHGLGTICQDFDQQLLRRMRDGKSAELANLTSTDLIENGGIEFRQWLVMLGALGEARPEWLVYEPLFQANMGMAVGYWPLEFTAAAAA